MYSMQGNRGKNYGPWSSNYCQRILSKKIALTSPTPVPAWSKCSFDDALAAGDDMQNFGKQLEKSIKKRIAARGKVLKKTIEDLKKDAYDDALKNGRDPAKAIKNLDELLIPPPEKGGTLYENIESQLKRSPGGATQESVAKQLQQTREMPRQPGRAYAGGGHQAAGPHTRIAGRCEKKQRRKTPHNAAAPAQQEKARKLHARRRCAAEKNGRRQGRGQKTGAWRGRHASRHAKAL